MNRIGHRVLLVALGLVATGSCSRNADEAPQSIGGPEPGHFVDVAADVGLDFVHHNGMSGEYYLCEIMAGGVGLFDYDRDGDLDVYLVQGAMLDAGATGSGRPLGDRLYRNDLSKGADGRPVLRFTDVTDQSGIEARGYGMGVATGDYDNDGWLDLYVTNFGSNQMFRNKGDGTFADVTAETGTDDPAWSVSAAFVDVDGDGWLDLYVGNYVDLTLETNKECYNLVRDYCSPSAYRPVADRLFRNLGNGSFADVTAASQLGRAYGSGLGVVTADFNLDGKIDLYVANDGTPNQCWINRGGGVFEDTALLAGCALNERGDAEAGMGVTAGDFDGDADEDLFLTHLRGETNTLYVNDGAGVFTDATVRFGLGSPSRPHTGFGTSWFDYDNDGLLDLISVNGAVTAIEALVHAGDPYPYHERNQLFHNEGDGRFRDVSADAGPEFERSEVSRGAAFGDVDNDGDVDVLVGGINAPVRLLLNRMGEAHHWIGLSMQRGDLARDELGAWVGVLRSGRVPLWRRVRTDGSYASASDSRLLFGLGDHSGPVTVRARWPSGLREEWTDQATDRWLVLREGSGTRIQ